MADETEPDYVATLMLAAVSMREEHGPEHPRHAMWAAMSTLLAGAAGRAQSKVARGGIPRVAWSHERHALAVAEAYLDALSAKPNEPPPPVSGLIGHPIPEPSYRPAVSSWHCRGCGHCHTPTGCIGDPTPSDLWAGVTPAACDCDAVYRPVEAGDSK